MGHYPALRVDRIMSGLPPNADLGSAFTAGVTTRGNYRSSAAVTLARLLSCNGARATPVSSRAVTTNGNHEAI
jgi:hypothetical protein